MQLRVAARCWTLTLRVFVVLLQACSGGGDETTPCSGNAAARESGFDPLVITVNASADVSVSGRDDLFLARKMFSSATNEGNLDAMWPFAQAVGVNRLRAINIGDESVLNAAGDFVAGARLIGPLDKCLQLGLLPHLVVATKPPDHLPPQPWSWTQDIWDQYADYAYKFILCVAEDHAQRGFDEFWVEATNEWDIAGGNQVWPLRDQVTQFAPERFDAYLRVYKRWAQAVQRVRDNNPSKKILMGGYGGTSPVSGGDRKLIDLRVNEGLLLDWISLHYYGGQSPVFSEHRTCSRSNELAAGRNFRGHCGRWRVDAARARVGNFGRLLVDHSSPVCALALTS
jgi:hypothetical protein